MLNSPGPIIHPSHKTYYLTAREDTPDSFSKDLYDWAGIALSCQQLYDETSLLIFQLSTTHISRSCVPRLLRCLQAPQKAAIHTIRFESRALKYSEDGDLESLKKLHVFQGLKRVVVKNNRKWFKLTRLEKKRWVVQMRSYAKNQKLEVVFEEEE